MKNCPRPGFMISVEGWLRRKWTEGGGADQRPITGGRLDEAALSFTAEPVAFVNGGPEQTAPER